MNGSHSDQNGGSQNGHETKTIEVDESNEETDTDVEMISATEDNEESPPTENVDEKERDEHGENENSDDERDPVAELIAGYDSNAMLLDPALRERLLVVEKAWNEKQEAFGQAAGVRYRFVSKWSEDHKKAIFAIKFFPFGSDNKNICATCGSNRVTVYELNSDGSVTTLQVYVDEAWDESFVAFCWAVDHESKAPLIAVGGQLGLIKVINCHEQTFTKVLRGHGNMINQLVGHPNDSNIIISCSNDQSARIWNLHTGMCIAIFTGHDGHRSCVLTADWHMSGTMIATGGMDHAVKIWKLENMNELIENSYRVPQDHENVKPRLTVYDDEITLQKCDDHTKKFQKFPTLMEQFPIYSRQKIHTNYVDHVRWYGDLIISKSTESKLVIWKPPLDDLVKSPEILCELEYQRSDIWFVRFAMTNFDQVLAVGNKRSQIYVWNLQKYFEIIKEKGFVDENGAKTYKPFRLDLPRMSSVVRMISFSSDFSTMVACCDDGSVVRCKKMPVR